MAQADALARASPTSRRHAVLAGILAEAAKLGHVTAAESALVELSDVNIPVRGYTALGWAAVYGHANVACEILAHKSADVNLRSGPDDAWTPLMLAVCEGHIDVVKLLLSYRETDPNLGESHGESPIYCAALKNHACIMHALCADARVDVNQRTGLDGSTALCVAAEFIISELRRTVWRANSSGESAPTKYFLNCLLSMIFEKRDITRSGPSTSSTI